MQWAKKLDSRVQKINALLMHIACIFLGILVVACVLMVLTRFIPNFTLTGLEEIARYSFIFLTFFSAGAGAGSNAHPGLTLLRDALPQKGRFVLDLIIYTFILLFGLIFIFYGFQATAGVSKLISTSWRIPMPVIYSSAVLGGIFITGNTINNMLQLIICGNDKRSAEIEEVQIVAAQNAETEGGKCI
ncbi:TRAP transporter small permease [Butyricicoccus faecihominis]|uniref:TRAP transporter small permease n=1 Tax=Butyricicoccaceae TaxID=3085642 RepID=UPI00247B15E7|nr:MULTISPECIES: TRAP transporter small permease [Butyricicoccaceae]MCQ5131361.1 TRAP transporter small permease [Butyricicoccus faecihominis]WNX83043.1 TRAP transporter small permease [Agathobaculum sp. NTUH-O15-33]